MFCELVVRVLNEFKNVTDLALNDLEKKNSCVFHNCYVLDMILRYD